ncbi:hypothetical protein [Fluviicola taffensis]|nr:hypothetical protein [Fluviicola taffensis]
MKLLFLMTFLLGSGYSFAQTPSVKPVKKEFFLNDTLSFIFDGVIRNDRFHEWKKPVWGVLRRSITGWDTLIHVQRQERMDTLVPYSIFQNYKHDFIIIDTLYRAYKDNELYPKECLFKQNGTYMLTILSGDGKEIVYSEPFSISTKTTIDAQLAEELRLSLDTLSIGDNKFTLEASLWRDMSQRMGGNQTNCYSELKEVNHLLPNEIVLKKQYVVHENEVWIGDYEQIKKTKTVIETIVRNGPKWSENVKVDVICEFEYAGKTYRVISKSRLIGSVE